MENKKEWKACAECLKIINISKGKEKYVVMATKNREENLLDEISYYHFQCFVDWINDKVKEKATHTIQNMQSESMKQLENTWGLIPTTNHKDIILKTMSNRRIKKYGDDKRRENKGGRPKRQ